MQGLVQVGAQKDAIVEARKTILDILKMQRGDKVTKAALESLKSVCAVNVTISDCTFSVAPKAK